MSDSWESEEREHPQGCSFFCALSSARGFCCPKGLLFYFSRTVRESAIRAVMQIQSWRHKAASNRAHVEEKNGKYVVWCNIGDLGSDVFQLQLTMPDKLTAEMTKNMFIAHGSDIYSKLMDMLTQPGTDDDRPPEALL